MEAVLERCAGLDVHQGSVVVCVLLGAAGRKPRKEVRTFATVRIPRDRGRGFHGIVGVKSTGRRAAIPRDRGHLGSGA